MWTLNPSAFITQTRECDGQPRTMKMALQLLLGPNIIVFGYPTKITFPAAPYNLQMNEFDHNLLNLNKNENVSNVRDKFIYRIPYNGTSCHVWGLPLQRTSSKFPPNSQSRLQENLVAH